MENSFDFLLILDSDGISANYNISDSSHSSAYLPFIKQKDLYLSTKIVILENLAQTFRVPYSFLVSQLKRLSKTYRSNKQMVFPINLSKICEKWITKHGAKSLYTSIKRPKRKTNSNETKSTENEDQNYLSISSDGEFILEEEPSVIMLAENFNKKSKNELIENPKSEKNGKIKKDLSFDLSDIDIEIAIELKKHKTPHKKTKFNDSQEKENCPLLTNLNKNGLNLNFETDFQIQPPTPEKLKDDITIKYLNEIDNEGISDFVFLENNMISSQVSQYYKKAEEEFMNEDIDFKIACNCKGSCNKDCVCARFNKQYLKDNPPYKLTKNSNNSKVLRKEINQDNIKPFSHIFECSQLCSCKKDLCNYQLLGWDGLKLINDNDLIVKRYKKKFKGSTEEIVMWGLMTNRRIPINTLVIEYLGEIITKGEADKRGKFYDTLGKNYLFDLTMAVEYKGDDKFGAIFCIDNYMKHRKLEEKKKLLQDFPLCIDGYYYGNLSRFINHSCDPNLQVLSIHVDNREILLPRVVLFSTRDIEKGEELTFDYNCYPLSSDKELKCACGEPTCRGSIYK